MHRLSWIVSLVLLWACGGGSQVPPVQTTTAAQQPAELPAVHKRGGSKLIAEIGPAGGTLELANGARLTIPEGALAAPAQVTFAEGTHTTAFANREYEKTIGPILEIGPELTPGLPLEVSVPLARLPEGFEEADLTLGLEVEARTQRAIEMHGIQTRWDYRPAGSKGGRIVASLQEVPGLRLQFLVSRTD